MKKRLILVLVVFLLVLSMFSVVAEDNSDCTWLCQVVNLFTPNENLAGEATTASTTVTVKSTSSSLSYGAIVDDLAEQMGIDIANYDREVFLDYLKSNYKNELFTANGQWLRAGASAQVVSLSEGSSELPPATVADVPVLEDDVPVSEPVVEAAGATISKSSRVTEVERTSGGYEALVDNNGKIISRDSLVLQMTPEQRDARARIIASKISEEVEKWNTDEDKVLELFRGLESEDEVKRVYVQYKSLTGNDLTADLNDVLDSRELNNLQSIRESKPTETMLPKVEGVLGLELNTGFTGEISRPSGKGMTAVVPSDVGVDESALIYKEPVTVNPELQLDDNLALENSNLNKGGNIRDLDRLNSYLSADPDLEGRLELTGVNVDKLRGGDAREVQKLQTLLGFNTKETVSGLITEETITGVKESSGVFRSRTPSPGIRIPLQEEIDQQAAALIKEDLSADEIKEIDKQIAAELAAASVSEPEAVPVETIPPREFFDENTLTSPSTTGTILITENPSLVFPEELDALEEVFKERGDAGGLAEIDQARKNLLSVQSMTNDGTNTGNYYARKQKLIQEGKISEELVTKMESVSVTYPGAAKRVYTRLLREGTGDPSQIELLGLLVKINDKDALKVSVENSVLSLYDKAYPPPVVEVAEPIVPSLPEPEVQRPALEGVVTPAHFDEPIEVLNARDDVKKLDEEIGIEKIILSDAESAYSNFKDDQNLNDEQIRILESAKAGLYDEDAYIRRIKDTSVGADLDESLIREAYQKQRAIYNYQQRVGLLSDWGKADTPEKQRFVLELMGKNYDSFVTSASGKTVEQRTQILANWQADNNAGSQVDYHRPLEVPAGTLPQTLIERSGAEDFTWTRMADGRYEKTITKDGVTTRTIGEYVPDVGTVIPVAQTVGLKYSYLSEAPIPILAVKRENELGVKAVIPTNYGDLEVTPGTVIEVEDSDFWSGNEKAQYVWAEALASDGKKYYAWHRVQEDTAETGYISFDNYIFDLDGDSVSTVRVVGQLLDDGRIDYSSSVASLELTDNPSVERRLAIESGDLSLLSLRQIQEMRLAGDVVDSGGSYYFKDMNGKITEINPETGEMSPSDKQAADLEGLPVVATLSRGRLVSNDVRQAADIEAAKNVVEDLQLPIPSDVVYGIPNDVGEVAGLVRYSQDGWVTQDGTRLKDSVVKELSQSYINGGLTIGGKLIKELVPMLEYTLDSAGVSLAEAVARELTDNGISVNTNRQDVPTGLPDTVQATVNGEVKTYTLKWSPGLNRYEYVPDKGPASFSAITNIRFASPIAKAEVVRPVVEARVSSASVPKGDKTSQEIKAREAELSAQLSTEKRDTEKSLEDVKKKLIKDDKLTEAEVDELEAAAKKAGTVQGFADTNYALNTASNFNAFYNAVQAKDKAARQVELVHTWDAQTIEEERYVFEEVLQRGDYDAQVLALTSEITPLPATDSTQRAVSVQPDGTVTVYATAEARGSAGTPALILKPTDKKSADGKQTVYQQGKYVEKVTDTRVISCSIGETGCTPCGAGEQCGMDYRNNPEGVQLGHKTIDVTETVFEGEGKYYTLDGTPVNSEGKIISGTVSAKNPTLASINAQPGILRETLAVEKEIVDAASGDLYWLRKDGTMGSGSSYDYAAELGVTPAAGLAASKAYTENDLDLPKVVWVDETGAIKDGNFLEFNEARSQGKALTGAYKDRDALRTVVPEAVALEEASGLSGAVSDNEDNFNFLDNALRTGALRDSAQYNEMVGKGISIEDNMDDVRDKITENLRRRISDIPPSSVDDFEKSTRFSSNGAIYSKGTDYYLYDEDSQKTWKFEGGKFQELQSGMPVDAWLVARKVDRKLDISNTDVNPNSEILNALRTEKVETGASEMKFGESNKAPDQQTYTDGVVNGWNNLESGVTVTPAEEGATDTSATDAEFEREFGDGSGTATTASSGNRVLDMAILALGPLALTDPGVAAPVVSQAKTINLPNGVHIEFDEDTDIIKKWTPFGEIEITVTNKGDTVVVDHTTKESAVYNTNDGKWQYFDKDGKATDEASRQVGEGINRALIITKALKTEGTIPEPQYQLEKDFVPPLDISHLEHLSQIEHGDLKIDLNTGKMYVNVHSGDIRANYEVDTNGKLTAVSQIPDFETLGGAASVNDGVYDPTNEGVFDSEIATQNVRALRTAMRDRAQSILSGVKLDANSIRENSEALQSDAGLKGSVVVSGNQLIEGSFHTADDGTGEILFIPADDSVENTYTIDSNNYAATRVNVAASAQPEAPAPPVEVPTGRILYDNAGYTFVETSENTFDVFDKTGQKLAKPISYDKIKAGVISEKKAGQTYAGDEKLSEPYTTEGVPSTPAPLPSAPISAAPVASKPITAKDYIVPSELGTPDTGGVYKYQAETGVKGALLTDLYYKRTNSGWEWSSDKETWMPTSTTTDDGALLFKTPTEANVAFIQRLERERVALVKARTPVLTLASVALPSDASTQDATYAPSELSFNDDGRVVSLNTETDTNSYTTVSGTDAIGKPFSIEYDTEGNAISATYDGKPVPEANLRDALNGGDFKLANDAYQAQKLAESSPTALEEPAAPAPPAATTTPDKPTTVPDGSRYDAGTKTWITVDGKVYDSKYGVQKPTSVPAGSKYDPKGNTWVAPDGTVYNTNGQTTNLKYKSDGDYEFKPEAPVVSAPSPSEPAVSPAPTPVNKISIGTVQIDEDELESILNTDLEALPDGKCPPPQTTCWVLDTTANSVKFIGADGIHKDASAEDLEHFFTNGVSANGNMISINRVVGGVPQVTVYQGTQQAVMSANAYDFAISLADPKNDPTFTTSGGVTTVSGLSGGFTVETRQVQGFTETTLKKSDGAVQDTFYTVPQVNSNGQLDQKGRSLKKSEGWEVVTSGCGANNLCLQNLNQDERLELGRAGENIVMTEKDNAGFSTRTTFGDGYTTVERVNNEDEVTSLETSIYDGAGNVVETIELNKDDVDGTAADQFERYDKEGNLISVCYADGDACKNPGNENQIYVGREGKQCKGTREQCQNVPADSPLWSADCSGNKQCEDALHEALLNRISHGRTTVQQSIGAILNFRPGWDSLSSLIFPDETNKWRKWASKTFDQAMLVEYQVPHAVCDYDEASRAKTTGQSAVLIEVAPGITQAVGSIQAEKTASPSSTNSGSPMLCSLELPCKSGECDEGVCKVGNNVVMTTFYKISWAVSAPRDETFTPLLDENGIAVKYNIKLITAASGYDYPNCNSEAPGLWLYTIDGIAGSSTLKLTNGESDRDVIYTYSENVYNSACVFFSSPPNDLNGDKIDCFCADFATISGPGSVDWTQAQAEEEEESGAVAAEDTSITTQNANRVEI